MSPIPADLSRRGALGLVAAIPLGLAACQSEDPSQTVSAKPMTTTPSRTYVLVHGAWHGGWCWTHVRASLEAAGHRVFTPTLTGLGERVHLLTPETGLDTHIQDVINVIEFEELTNIELVGHSYGGMVITGVADALKDRIARITYLDAARPDDGENFAAQAPGADAAMVSAIEAQFRTLSRDGLVMDTFPPAVLDVDPSDVKNTEWLKAKMTPHPLKTWLDPIALKNGGSDGLKRHYVFCNEPALQNASFGAHYASLEGDESWTRSTMPTGHESMITHPGLVVAQLLTT